MSLDLKMEVYTPALELAGMLNEWQSVIWEEKAFAAGSFSLNAPITNETIQLLVADNILWMEGDTAGIIEHRELESGDSGPYITVKGRLLTCILDFRILWGLYDLYGTPADIMRYLVNDCCIAPTRGDTGARKIPGLVLAGTGSTVPGPEEPWPGPGETYYTISATVSPPGSGTVTGAGRHKDGATVSLNATANDGYSFKEWKEGGEAVNSGAIYSFTAEKDRNLTAAFEEVPSVVLPEGYTRLEYIQSDGNQYIDTGIKPTSTIKTVIDVEPLFANSGSAAIYISGCSLSGSGTKYYFLTRWYNGVGVGTGSSTAAVSFKTLSDDSAPRRLKVTVDYPNKTAFVEGGNKVTLSSIATSTSMPTIKLLGVNSGAGLISAKLYSFFLENSNTSMELVPCINPDGAVGMYDIINDTFYDNAGSGTFTAGPVSAKAAGVSLSSAINAYSSAQSIQTQKTGGSLLDALETIGRAYGVAFGVRFNAEIPRMEFWTRCGVNRSVNQTSNDPVFYSTELDDVLSSQYSYDSSQYRNVALVAGEGDGDGRKTAVVELDIPDAGENPVVGTAIVGRSIVGKVAT